MSDEFELEDDLPVEKPVEEKKSKDDFDPFADVKVDVSEDKSEVPKASPKSPSASPSNDPVLDEDDGDIKPGSGKDLWACPHCGTKNKPARTDCRKCNKNLDDEITKKKPVGLIVAVVVIAIILIAVMATGGKDFSLQAPSANNVNDNVITDTSSKKIAACGRVIRSSSKKKDITITVIFGELVNDDKKFKGMRIMKDTVQFSNGLSASCNYATFIINNDDGEFKKPSKGKYISITGTYSDSNGNQYNVDADNFEIEE